MEEKMKSMLASYARSFVVAGLAVYSAGETDWKAVLIAGVVAIVGPAIRALNPNDPAFGMIADVAEKEITKVAKKSAKKVAKKK